MGRLTIPVEFQGVSDQVLEELDHLNPICLHCRQITDFHAGILFPDHYLQVGQCLLNRFLEIRVFLGSALVVTREYARSILAAELILRCNPAFLLRRIAVCIRRI
jgi:hypothetical protein